MARMLPPAFTTGNGRRAVFCPLVLLSCLLVGFTANAQWTRKADAHRKRSEVTSVVYDNKLYTFLGFSNSALEVESSSEVYDPATDTWKLLAPIPAGKAVTHQGVALVDNTVWHIGGRVGKNPGPLTSEIWIYNITTNAWTPGPRLTDPATGEALLWGGCGAVLLGRTLHVFGGFVINACNNDQDKYHLTLDVDQWLSSGVASWKNERKPLPMKRCHFATLTLGGRIYALGGQFGHDCGNQDHGFSHAYNPVTDTWTQLTTMPNPRSHAEGGVFPLDGKIYLVAGQEANSVNTNKVAIFDPAGNNGAGSWTDAPDLRLPYNYEGVSAKVINNLFIYSHGGVNGSANTQNRTYVRTISRKPVHAFGFSASCLTLSGSSGQVVSGKNLLFTFDAARTYSLSSSASWLSVSKNASGTAIASGVDIGVNANTAGLAPGKYTATVTARATGSGPAYAAVSFCVNLTVTPAATGNAIVRINAGGAATTVNGVTWSGCAATGSCGGYVRGGFAYTQQPPPVISGVMAPLSQSILQTEWTGGQTNGVPAGSVAFSYQIPVPNGNYRVRLHFVELNKNGAGLRKFDVNIEGGAKELGNFDIFAEAGGIHKAIYRDFPVNISDGNLNIDFIRQVENAKVAAIEVFPENAPSTAIYQAEEAQVYLATVARNHGGFTGSGFVDYINASGDYIEWSLTQASATTATLQFRYALSSSANRTLRLEINGKTVNENLVFTPTGGWSAWKTVSVNAALTAGANKVKLTAKGSSGPNVDYLSVTNGTGLRTAEEAVVYRSIRVSPNPASGSAVLTLGEPSSEQVRVQVVSPLGVVVRAFDAPGGNPDPIHLPLDGLAAGMYLIRVQSASYRQTLRLMVE